MLPAPLTFEYIRLLEEGDRVRRTRGRPTGSRIRRTVGASGRD
jgi:hypothetical protein